jgi:hypothetical protein
MLLRSNERGSARSRDLSGVRGDVFRHVSGGRLD